MQVNMFPQAAFPFKGPNFSDRWGGAVRRGQTAVGTQICLGHIPSCHLCFRNQYWAFLSGILLGFLLCFAWLLFGQVGDFSSDSDSCLLHDAEL